MQCYLCNSKKFKQRKGVVRDTPELQIMECENCGLVTLNTIDHIGSGFYENSGMHGKDPKSIESWLKETEWDDQRRFDMIKSMLPNNRVLDFGCGAGAFLQRASQLTDKVTGVELEARVRDYWSNTFDIFPGLENAGGGGGVRPDHRLSCRRAFA